MDLQSDKRVGRGDATRAEHATGNGLSPPQSQITLPILPRADRYRAITPGAHRQHGGIVELGMSPADHILASRQVHQVVDAFGRAHYLTGEVARVLRTDHDKHDARLRHRRLAVFGQDYP
jgi:hypothetical protein